MFTRRPKSTKEYDQQLNSLRNENFHLKLRLFLLEEKMEKNQINTKQNGFRDVNDRIWSKLKWNLCEKDEVIETLQTKLKDKERDAELLKKNLDDAKKELEEAKKITIENESFKREKSYLQREITELKRDLLKKAEEVAKPSQELNLNRMEKCINTENGLNGRNLNPFCSSINQQNKSRDKRGGKVEVPHDDNEVERLRRRLSISEDNVLHLMKVLEIKDKMLSALLRKNEFSS
ncbi:ERC protein 2-like [Centruroides vittatus]|uniref:ERC protein 2-like n=1 Tax=Centruroides vittatus TaxID=120091 RepID=UPI00350F43C5